MNGTKIFGCLALLLITALAALGSVHAQALPITLDRVEIDDIELLSHADYRLKTTKLNPKTILEEAILKICST